MVGFGDSDEKNCQRDPPDIVAQLGAELLVDGVAAGSFGGWEVLST